MEHLESVVNHPAVVAVVEHPLVKENWESLSEAIMKCFGYARDEINHLLDPFDAFQICLITIAAVFVFGIIKKILTFIWEEGIFTPIRRGLWEALKKTPCVKKKIAKEIAKNRESFRKHALKLRENPTFKLPDRGMNPRTIEQRIDKWSDRDSKFWKDGKISGCVYYEENEELKDLQDQCFSAFAYSNPLHADVFPCIRQMESEVCSMVVNMYNGTKDSCGFTTSGGTESLLLAMRAYRERGRVLHGITNPEIIVADSAHAAFWKAGEYFKIKVRSIPVCKKTGKADLKKMARAINSNTVCMAVASPSYPQGIVDDVPEASRIALKHKIPLHVDACLGGFVVPFMHSAGFKDFPIVDFRNPGVTSISCDTHKYGNCPKGTSVIMWRSRELRRFQYSAHPEWAGGMYVTPTIAGSRPGVLIAATWVTMVYYGYKGYVELTRKIVKAARRLAEEAHKIPEIDVMYKPQCSVVAFSCKKYNIYSINDALIENGWELNSLQNPAGIHFAITSRTCNSVDKFLADLRSAVEKVTANPQNYVKTSSAALYGSKTQINDPNLIEEVVRHWADFLSEN